MLIDTTKEFHVSYAVVVTAGGYTASFILHYAQRFIQFLVMCNNDFTTISIIMMFVSRYDSYHDSESR